MPNPRSLLRELLGGPIVAYHPRLAPLVGGVKAAVLLSQLYYLANQREDPESPFPASLEELRGSTGLSPKEQASARRELVRRGLVSVTRKGAVLGRNHYRLDLDALIGLTAGQLPLLPVPDSPEGKNQIVPSGESSFPQPAHLDSPKGRIRSENPQEGRRRAASGRADPVPPAAALCKRVLHRWPPKRTWPHIARTIGDDFPALLRWGRILRRWSLAGYNPTRFHDMLDIFRNGWRPSPAAGSRSRPRPSRPVGYDPAADVASYKKRQGMS